MKNKLFPIFWVVLLLAFFGVVIQTSALAAVGKKSTTKDDKNIAMPLEKKRRISHLLRDFVNNIHYSPRAIDEKLSQDWYKDFFSKIDPYKRIFLKEDSIQLSAYQKLLHQDILLVPYSGDFVFFKQFQTLYRQRLEQIGLFLDSLSTEKLDFTTNDFIFLNDSTQPLPLSTKEQKERFQKQIKWMILEQAQGVIEEDLDEVEMLAKQNEEKAKTENLTLAQKQEKAQKEVFRSLKKIYQKISQSTEEELFGIYLNSFLMVFDPHSGYYDPKQKDDFDESISGKFEGIGAVLGMKDGVYIYVAEVLPGGPAARQGELQNGDIILKVAQGDEEPESIEGLWTSDAVKLIRGKKGTLVKLTVRKPDQSIKIIPILRDIVVKEEAFAKTAIITHQKQKIGYIYLPSFYVDVTGEGPKRNSSDDVIKALQQLNKEKVDGIILDVRNNTGGSLQDVVSIANALVGSGNVVQVKSKDQPAQHLQDFRITSAIYTGPLVVMVNQYSASASEILAAAIQDYHRGIIFGSKNTFGKGTVQRFFELDQYVSGFEDYNKWIPFGALKLTLQKFYRISGKSTQLNGVASDIVVPDVFDASEEIEKRQAFALACDSIGSLSEYQKKRPAYQDAVIQNSQKRVKDNHYFKLLQQKLTVLESSRKEKKFSLNEKDFQKRKENYQAKLKPYDTLNKMYTQLEADLLTKQWPTDSITLAKEAKFVENLRKDFQLEEAAQVILDLKKLMRK